MEHRRPSRPTPGRGPLVPAAALLALGAAVGSGWAQSSADVLPLPQDNRFITLKDPNLWTTTVQVTLTYYSDTVHNDNAPSVYIESWDYNDMTVVFPFIESTASSTRTMDKIRGELFVDSHSVDDKPTIIGPYQSQAVYARWDGGAGKGVKAIRLVQSEDLVCYETIYHEDQAATLEWPTTPWPAEADSTFQPQQFVSNVRSSMDVDTPVTRLVRQWTDGKDPRAVRPALLAKFLAGRVLEHVRTVLPPTTTERDADPQTRRAYSDALSGFLVQSADVTAASGEGTLHDMTVLLAAVYRAAGIPARIVIGYDENEDSKTKQLRSWVEFALFDEGDPKDTEDDVLAWIPVDIGRMRERSNRAYPLNQKWKYFGTHDELDDTVPLALHFHPPTAVRSYRPALFGWTLDTGTPVRANQYVDINVTHTPNTPEWRRQNEDRRRKSRRQP